MHGLRKGERGIDQLAAHQLFSSEQVHERSNPSSKSPMKLLLVQAGGSKAPMRAAPATFKKSFRHISLVTWGGKLNEKDHLATQNAPAAKHQKLAKGSAVRPLLLVAATERPSTSSIRVRKVEKTSSKGTSMALIVVDAEYIDSGIRKK